MSQNLKIEIKKNAYVNISDKKAVLHIEIIGTVIVYGREINVTDSDDIEYNLVEEEVSKTVDWLNEHEKELMKGVQEKLNRILDNIQTIEKLGYTLVFQ